MAIEYESVEGHGGPHSLILYSLSFCTSCREASSFLREQGLGFRYAYVDQLPTEERLTLKKSLTPANPKDLMYPILEIDGTERLYGFKREIWQLRLSGAR